MYVTLPVGSFKSIKQDRHRKKTTQTKQHHIFAGFRVFSTITPVFLPDKRRQSISQSISEIRSVIAGKEIMTGESGCFYVCVDQTHSIPFLRQHREHRLSHSRPSVPWLRGRERENILTVIVFIHTDGMGRGAVRLKVCPAATRRRIASSAGLRFSG